MDKIEFIYPTPGYTASGYFSLSGYIASKSTLDKVTLLLDKQPLGVVEVNAHRYFHYPLGPETLKDGEHVFEVQANLPDGTLIESPDLFVTYRSEGPWIKIDNFQPGDFVTGRPFLKGSAGYFMQPFPEEKKEDKAGYEAYQKMLKEARVKTISLSFDNGKTFKKLGEKEKWQYRLETGILKAGNLYILVKGEFANGSSAITQTILKVDTKLPSVAMLVPEEGQKFNDKLEVLGTASDENGLESVSIACVPATKTATLFRSLSRASILISMGWV